MARIQSKRCGRKPPSMRLKSPEIRNAAEESLARRGASSVKWTSESVFAKNRKTSTE